MSAQFARRILSEEAPAPGGRARVRLELGCGCEVELEMDAQRLVTTADGQQLAVGKFRCPRGHPPGRGVPRES